MPLDELQINHLARLARLELTEDEKKKYSEQISQILDYFEQLKGIDTAGIAPLTHVSEQNNVFREDEVKQIFSEDRVLAEAPEIVRRQVKVKLVLDNKERKKSLEDDLLE